MRTLLRAGILWVWSLGLLAVSGRAQDVFYSDLNESSPTGRYQVTAKSAAAPRPKKRGKQPPAPAKFVYVCKDTETKKVLWTLPQPKGGADKATVPPPVRLSVSDDGWTVIFTGAEFIPVDPQGNPHGKALLSEALSAEEQESHTQRTTLGPTWTNKSLWYFVTVESMPYLVVRPWWGHRVAVDLEHGKIVEPIPASVEAAGVADEREKVLSWLQEGANTFQAWEKGGNPKQALLTNDAAYLAGSLRLPEAIPLLRRLEPTIYNGESSLQYIDESERKQHLGEVNPFTHRANDLRRLVQLSLRRLGETPQPLPCTVLERAGKDYHDRIVYEPPVLTVPRTDNVDKIKVGMRSEEVCELLGVPDYIVSTNWEYDLDTTPGHTLVIQWKNWHVTGLTTVEPRWLDPALAEEREF